MRKIVVSNAFLEEVATLLAEGRSVRVRIDGQSMFPFIIGGQDEVELVPYEQGSVLPLWCVAFFKWHGTYIVHRFIGKQDALYCMMGDGNLAQVEHVEEKDILGVLQFIYHPDGTLQDCRDSWWMMKGKNWYKLRRFRRYLLYFHRICMRFHRK